MLPNVFDDWIIFRPKTEKEVQKDLLEYLAIGYTKESYFKYIKSYYEAIKILNKLKVNKNSAFFEFYSTFTNVDSSEREEADLMYSLEEILEDYENPY